MNKVIISGRLTSDPKVTYSQAANGPLAIAKYRLAVDRRFHRDGEPTADFISCVAFGKAGEFAEKFMTKGRKFIVCGRIQTGSYKNKDGQTVYTTDVIVEEQDFADAKPDGQRAAAPAKDYTPAEDFESIPADIDEELPFN